MPSYRLEALNFFAKNQNTSLSYCFTVKSPLIGPKIVVIGGLHGNEPVGVEAIIQFQNKAKNLRKGEITFILGNPQAYLQNVRFINSNLNRSFIPDFTDDYEGSRAKEITDFLKKYKPDYLLDLHSVSVGDLKMEVHRNIKSIKEGIINPDYLQIILTQKASTGSAIHLKFIDKTLCLECGNHTSKTGLNAAISKIKEILNFYDMADFSTATTDSRSTIFAYTLTEPIIPKPDFQFVNPDITSEVFVKKNQIYALSGSTPIISPGNRYIIMPSKNPNINDTDAGFLAQRTKIVFSRSI